MKKVLVNGGARIFDIVAIGATFDVAPPFRWVDAPDSVSHTTHVFDGAAIVTKPAKSLPEEKASKLVELKSAWDNTQNLGISTRGKTFASGGQARAQLDRLLAAQANGITIPTTIRADGGRGVDPGRVFGSAQSDLLEDHSHNYNSSTGATQFAGSAGTGPYNVVTAASAGVNGGIGGTETRPRNIALLPCIKY